MRDQTIKIVKLPAPHVLSMSNPSRIFLKIENLIAAPSMAVGPKNVGYTSVFRDFRHP